MYIFGFFWYRWVLWKLFALVFGFFYDLSLWKEREKYKVIDIVQKNKWEIDFVEDTKRVRQIECGFAFLIIMWSLILLLWNWGFNLVFRSDLAHFFRLVVRSIFVKLYLALLFDRLTIFYYYVIFNQILKLAKYLNVYDQFCNQILKS